jgi:hypothetical protein
MSSQQRLLYKENVKDQLVSKIKIHEKGKSRIKQLIQLERMLLIESQKRLKVESLKRLEVESLKRLIKFQKKLRYPMIMRSQYMYIMANYGTEMKHTLMKFYICYSN